MFGQSRRIAALEAAQAEQASVASAALALDEEARRDAWREVTARLQAIEARLDAGEQALLALTARLDSVDARGAAGLAALRAEVGAGDAARESRIVLASEAAAAEQERLRLSLVRVEEQVRFEREQAERLGRALLEQVEPAGG